MNKKHTESEKQAILDRYENGESVVDIASSTGIPRSTIYAWLKERQPKIDEKELSPKNLRNLENKIKRFEGIIEILQKANCRYDDPLELKLNALEELHGQYSVHMLCKGT